MARGVVQPNAPGVGRRERNLLLTRHRVCCQEEPCSRQCLYPDVRRGGGSRGHRSACTPYHRPRTRRAWNLRYLSQSSVHLLLLGLVIAQTEDRPEAAAIPGRLKTLTERPRSGPVTISDRNSLNSRSTLVPAASEAHCIEISHRFCPHYSSSITFTLSRQNKLPSLVAQMLCTQSCRFVYHAIYCYSPI